MRLLGNPLLLALFTASSAHALILGSFNVRYDNPGDVERGDDWPRRAPVVANLIQFHNFDVLGTQEAFHHQVEDLQKLLPGYDHTGVGRDDGEQKGEFAAIFFKKDKFRLLDSGTFWLSETPEEPGSRGWDADLPRICTWAKLEPTDGGEPFWMFNVHFDHRGREARLESARLVLEKIEELAGDDPVVLAGDFNVNQDNEAYRLLHGSERLDDAREHAAVRYELNGTANNFRMDFHTESRIDHIFLSSHFKPLRWGVLTDSYRVVPPAEDEENSGNFPGEVRFREAEARLPSDHYPVLAEVERR